MVRQDDHRLESYPSRPFLEGRDDGVALLIPDVPGPHLGVRELPGHEPHRYRGPLVQHLVDRGRLQSIAYLLKSSADSPPTGVDA